MSLRIANTAVKVAVSNISWGVNNVIVFYAVSQAENNHQSQVIGQDSFIAFTNNQRKTDYISSRYVSPLISIYFNHLFGR